MTPNVRDKLCDIDHLLDEEYTTVKIKMAKKVTVEMVNDPTTKTDGKKMTERKYVEVERDLTILKDPVRFITRIIEGCGIYEIDAMKRISIVGKDNSMRFNLNFFDRNQDPEITFPKVEWSWAKVCLYIL